MAPLISVIIPTYNYGRFIQHAIDSVRRQTLKSVQIVVVDDGSTDHTQELFASADFADVKYVRQVNKGLAGARNTGIAAADGEFVFFLDADDSLHERALETVLQCMNERGLDCAVVACRPEVRVLNVETGEERVFEPEEFCPQQSLAVEVQWRDLMLASRFPPSVLVRRGVLASCGGFDESFSRLGCEDRDMWLRVARHHRIWMVPQRLVTVTFHGSNMSGSPEKQVPGIRKCLDKARADAPVPWWHLGFWMCVRSSFHCTVAMLYWDAGAVHQALAHQVKALVSYPFPGLSRKLQRPPLWRARRLWVMLREMAAGRAGVRKESN